MDIDSLDQSDINIEPKKLTINGEAPKVGKRIPNKPSLMGLVFSWHNDNKEYRIIPKNYGGNGFSYQVEILDKSTGKYLDDYETLSIVEFDEYNKPVENFKEAFKEVRNKIL